MRRSVVGNQQGLSLIELLIVLAVMGFVMAAVYGFYESQMKTSMAQEDIVEVQQNLRIAMDMITHDIQKAGYLVPLDPVTNPLAAASSTGITINTASASGTTARVTANATTAATTVLSVESADSVDKFLSGDSARIIRPQDKSQPVSAIFQVSGVNRAGPSLTLSIDPVGTATVIQKGDVIVRTSSGVAHPNTISYSRMSGGSCPTGQNCIQRNATGTGNQLVATNIAPDADNDGADDGDGLRFSYLCEGNCSNGQPEIANPAAADMGIIRAVRVTLTGVTEKGVLVRDFGGAKQRSLTSIVSLRNRWVVLP